MGTLNASNFTNGKTATLTLSHSERVFFNNLNGATAATTASGTPTFAGTAVTPTFTGTSATPAGTITNTLTNAPERLVNHLQTSSQGSGTLTFNDSNDTLTWSTTNLASDATLAEVITAFNALEIVIDLTAGGPVTGVASTFAGTAATPAGTISEITPAGTISESGVTYSTTLSDSGANSGTLSDLLLANGFPARVEVTATTGSNVDNFVLQPGEVRVVNHAADGTNNTVIEVILAHTRGAIDTRDGEERLFAAAFT